jgi:RHS repeat-associated protein
MKGFNQPGGLFSRLAAIATLLLAIVPLPANQALADTSPNFPPTCAPLGANACSTRIPGPWSYANTVFCSGGPYPTEAQAVQWVIDAHQSNPNICTVDVHATGSWLVQGATTISKCGTIQNFLSLPYRDRNTLIVTRDFKPYEVIHTSSPPSCSNTTTTKYQVERVRSTACGPGTTAEPTYGTAVVDGTLYSQTYCQGPNDAKDFGEVCCENRKAGNPINVGSGNKIQVERDYSGASAGLLRFDRYYNSGGQRYGFMSSLGAEWTAQLGKHWRHTYDRRVTLVESGTLITAFVYRHDGKVLWYNLYNDVWYSDADVTSKLERLSSAGSFTGWKFTNSADGSVELYDASGVLQSITSRSGESVALAYNANGLLATATDAFGHQIQLAYDSNSQVGTVTVPGGSTYQYTYDTAGRLASVSNPDGSNKTYYYNETAHVETGANLPNALTGIDENGQRFATFKYFATGRAKSSEHAGGVELTTLTYPNNTQRIVIDALGQSRTYGVSVVAGVSRVTSISQPCTNCGAAGAVTYDTSGNVLSRTSFNGSKTCYAYDLPRNLETVRVEGFAAGISCPANLAGYSPTAGTVQRKITTQWHSVYRQPVQIDEPGKRTTFTHDAAGNVLSRTELDTATSVSRAWTYTFNSVGRVLTADGPRTDVSDVTTYTYHTCATGYQCGQVNTVTNAAGHVTTYSTYNAHGQPLTITDANGVVTTLTYDLRQRLTSRTVGSDVTAMTYWPTGLLKKTTLPDGGYLEYTYDAAHRLTDINDAEGNRIHYTLDLIGNRTGVQSYDLSNAMTRTRTRVYNALSRLYQEIGAAGTANVTTTFGYDNNGNQTSIVAPLGRDSTQVYDELNRLKQVTDPLNGITQYGYNGLSQLIAVTDPRNLVTSYSYNALGDLQQQTSPDTGVTANTYDSGGNLATSTDARSATATYTYDALNRVASAVFSSGSTTDQTLAYTYDAGTNGKGRLTGASDADHSLSWTYDDHGRPLTATQVVGSVSKTTSYSYANGLRQSMTTPSGQLITYSYTNGKVTGISVNGTVLISNILYDPFGPVRQWTWSNGSLSVRTFDQDGKVTQIDSASLKTYSYDDAFRITGITDTTNSALSWTYGYDDLDRLTSAAKTGTTLGYTYDTNGNRLSQTGAGASTFTIAANSNRLSSTSGTLTRTYGYDNAGNTTSFTGVTFTYNNRGRMKSSTKSGVTTNYTYNALGQLIKKGTSTLYYYDEAGHIIGIYNGSGALTEEIVWLGDTPIISLRPRAGGGINIYNIHTDHLNTPRLIVGSVNPGVRWRWDAEPFGGGTINNNPSGAGVFNFDLRFPGQIAMAETGLNYNYYRDYDPATGKYIESDPVGLKGGAKHLRLRFESSNSSS